MRLIKKTSFLQRIVLCYNFSLTIPERLYPFKAIIEGKKVRGRRSYDEAVAAYRAKFQTSGYGYMLIAYRQVFHVAGSILAITVATYMAHDLFGSDNALIFLLGFVVAFITYQEFGLQPRTHSQRWQKGIIDWAFWFTPILLYFFFYLPNGL
jgi:hypothetical protein